MPTELLDRLVGIIESGVLTEGAWYDLGVFLQMMLGGDRLAGVMVDTGRDYQPGTVGAETRKHSEIVSREAWFGLIRDRLAELIRDGLDEAFLIRAARDELRRYLAEFADASGRGATRRAELRESMERAGGDPALLAAYRARLVERDPSVQSMTDEEIAADLRRLAAKLLGPTPIEHAVDRWAALHQWDEQVGEHLSDETVETWRDRYMTRVIRRADS